MKNDSVTVSDTLKSQHLFKDPAREWALHNSVFQSLDEAKLYVLFKYYWNATFIIPRIVDPVDIARHRNIKPLANEVFVQCEAPFSMYAVSNMGRVISMHRIGWIFTHKDCKKKGVYKMKNGKWKYKRENYYSVSFSSGGEKESFHIHELVANIFCRNLIPQSEEQLEVHHLNNRPRDNRAENLIRLPRSIHTAVNNVEAFGFITTSRTFTCLTLADLRKYTGGIDDDFFGFAKRISALHKECKKKKHLNGEVLFEAHINGTPRSYRVSVSFRK